jgi:hypothetical protein
MRRPISPLAIQAARTIRLLVGLATLPRAAVPTTTIPVTVRVARGTAKKRGPRFWLPPYTPLLDVSTPFAFLENPRVYYLFGFRLSRERCIQGVELCSLRRL